MAETIDGSVCAWNKARAGVPADDDDKTVASVIGGRSGGGINSPRGERRGDTEGAARRGDVRRGVAAADADLAGDLPGDNLSLMRKARLRRAERTIFQSSLDVELHHGHVCVGVHSSHPKF